MDHQELLDLGSCTRESLYHSSPVFIFYSSITNKNYKFALDLRPKGGKESGDEDDVGIYFYNKNSEKINVEVTFSLPHSGNARLDFETSIEPFGGHGFWSIIKRSTLEQRSRAFLPDGHLVLKCDVTVLPLKDELNPNVTGTEEETLSKAMIRLLIDTTMSDLTIVSGGESLPCHKNIRANKSDVLLEAEGYVIPSIRLIHLMPIAQNRLIRCHNSCSEIMNECF